MALVVAYGLILPKAILDAPAKGCLNLHASLLPRWRGAAPIQRAIMAGDTETGVAVMRMEETLDTGPVALTERVAIGPEMTAGELHDELSLLGASLMARALDLLAHDALTFTPQADTGLIYAEKISKAEALIDWSRGADELHNLVRGLSPFPGSAFLADFGKGAERIKVLRSRTIDAQGPAGMILDDALTIACGHGALRLLEVQTRRQGADAGHRLSARRAAHAWHAAWRFSPTVDFHIESPCTFCLFNRIGSIRKPRRTFRSDAFFKSLYRIGFIRKTATHFSVRCSDAPLQAHNRI